MSLIIMKKEAGEGIWIEVETKDGKHAAINLSEQGGPLTGSILEQWAKEELDGFSVVKLSKVTFVPPLMELRAETLERKERSDQQFWEDVYIACVTSSNCNNIDSPARWADKALQERRSKGYK